MENEFKREIDALGAIFRFLHEAADAASVDQAVRFPLEMAVEELFTNMVKYNPAGSGGITISLERIDNSVSVSLVDTDSEPFDVTRERGVDTEAPLDERQVGGLGIHLVQRMMDEIYFEYRNRRTCIRLVKYLP